MHGGTEEDDRIDLAKLISTVWSHKQIAALMTGVFVLISILYLHVANRVYTASMTVVAAHNTASSDALGAGLGELASLAGIRLPRNSEASTFDVYLMAINTTETAGAMLKRKDIASVVFPAGWDGATGTWHEPNSLTGMLTRPFKWMLTGQIPNWTPPSPKLMADYIKVNVQVSRDKTTNAVAITFSHKDPAFAEHFLSVLHKTVDDSIRAKTLKDSTAYITYISRQLGVVTVTEQHDVLTRLLSDEEKKVILAGSGLPYAAEIFSAPYAPPSPTKPLASLVLAFGVFAGAAAGIAFILAATRVTIFAKCSEIIERRLFSMRRTRHALEKDGLHGTPAI